MRFLFSMISVVACLLLSVSSAYAQSYSAPIRLPGSSCVSGLGVNSVNGDLYAACFNTNNVQLFPGGVRSGQNATSLVGVCNGVEGVTFTSCYGYVYAACWIDNSVAAWSLGGQGTYGQLAGYIHHPHFVVVSPLDTIYASGDAGVSKWEQGGKVAMVSLGGCQYGLQIAVHPVSGDVFLACLGSNNVLRYVGGSSTVNVLASCTQAYGVQVSLNGDVFAACPGDNTVIHIPFNSTQSSYGPAVTLGSCLLGGPMVWKEYVGLFVSCQGENVVKLYTPSVITSRGSPILVGGCLTAGSLAVTDDGQTVYCGETANGTVRVVAFVAI